MTLLVEKDSDCSSPRQKELVAAAAGALEAAVKEGRRPTAGGYHKYDDPSRERLLVLSLKRMSSWWSMEGCRWKILSLRSCRWMVVCEKDLVIN